MEKSPIKKLFHNNFLSERFFKLIFDNIVMLIKFGVLNINFRKLIHIKYVHMKNHTNRINRERS